MSHSYRSRALGLSQHGDERRLHIRPPGAGYRTDPGVVLEIPMLRRVLFVSLACAVSGLGAPEASVADAIRRDDKPALRSLLQQKADVNIPLPDGSTALHWAVEGDDLETLDLLIQANANVKA